MFFYRIQFIIITAGNYDFPSSGEHFIRKFLRIGHHFIREVLTVNSALEKVFVQFLLWVFFRLLLFVLIPPALVFSVLFAGQFI